jgi:hypothetical protein
MVDGERRKTTSPAWTLFLIDVFWKLLFLIGVCSFGAGPHYGFAMLAFVLFALGVLSSLDFIIQRMCEND